MLVSSLAKTATPLDEAQLLALGDAFNSQMRHFSLNPRQMSGSLCSFSRLGRYPPNFELHSAERVILPALATYAVTACALVNGGQRMVNGGQRLAHRMRSNEVCSVLSGFANVYGTTAQRQQSAQWRAAQQGGVDEGAEDEQSHAEHPDAADPHGSGQPYTPRVVPSVDFLQRAVNVVASRPDDLPRYLSSLLWACCELRVLPAKADLAAMADAVPAMVRMVTSATWCLPVQHGVLPLQCAQ